MQQQMQQQFPKPQMQQSMHDNQSQQNQEAVSVKNVSNRDISGGAGMMQRARKGSSSEIMSFDKIDALNISKSDSKVGNVLLSTCLFVSNFDSSKISTDDLSLYFQDFGPIKYMKCGAVGTSTFAFVCFPSKQAADSALERTKTRDLGGYWMIAEFAVERWRKRMRETKKISIELGTNAKTKETDALRQISRLKVEGEKQAKEQSSTVTQLGVHIDRDIDYLEEQLDSDKAKNFINTHLQVARDLRSEFGEEVSVHKKKIQLIQAKADEIEKKGQELRMNYQKAWVQYKKREKVHKDQARARRREEAKIEMERKASEEKAAHKAADDERIRLLATQMATKMAQEMMMEQKKSQNNVALSSPSSDINVETPIAHETMMSPATQMTRLIGASMTEGVSQQQPEVIHHAKDMVSSRSGLMVPNVSQQQQTQSMVPNVNEYMVPSVSQQQQQQQQQTQQMQQANVQEMLSNQSGLMVPNISQQQQTQQTQSMVPNVNEYLASSVSQQHEQQTQLMQQTQQMQQAVGQETNKGL